MTQMEKDLHAYFREIGRHLSGRDKTRILSDLKTNVAVYLEEHAGASMIDVTEAFGTPEEIADYASVADRVPSRLSVNRYMLCAAGLVVLICTVIGMGYWRTQPKPVTIGMEASETIVSSSVMTDTTASDIDGFEIEVTDTCFYLVPESYKRKLVEEDIRALNKTELMLARNEIYARHGRRFLDAELQSYFDGQDWYRGTIEPEDFDPDLMLSNIESRNVIFLQRMENGR